MHKKENILTKLKRYLVSGILLWLPLIITFYILKFLFDFLNNTLHLIHMNYPTSALFGVDIPGMSFVIALVILLLTGALASNYFGKKLVDYGEKLVERIPLIRSIYKAIKQITYSVLSTNNKSFRKVVLIEYPRVGSYSLAFQTASTIQIDKVHPNLTTVFLPTTPNPTSGFLLLLPADQVTEVNIPVEDALKFIISLGTATPPDFLPQHKPVQ